MLGIVEGRSERDDPNNPTNSIIQLFITFETGEERFKWMNNKVFVGYGRKEGKLFQIDYYRIV